MPFDIRVRNPSTSAAQDAGVLTAYNTFIAAVQAAIGSHKADAGGTFIGTTKVTADETSKNREFGTPW